MTIYKPFDVVVVPFPFTDKASVKRRPALVLSSDKTFNIQAEHSVLAMITSAQNSSWPLDANIEDLAAAGLSASSIVRMKLFTLDERLILRKVGELSNADKQTVEASLQQLLPSLKN